MLTISFCTFCSAQEKENMETETFDWEPLMACLIKIESNGNPRAKSGIYVGVLQISPGMVRSCNNILAKRGSSKRFSLNDRYSVEKSKEMFVIFQSKFNPGNSIEKAIRSWQGGPRYTIRGTQRYYNKVMKLYEKTDA